MKLENHDSFDTKFIDGKWSQTNDEHANIQKQFDTPQTRTDQLVFVAMPTPSSPPEKAEMK